MTTHHSKRIPFYKTRLCVNGDKRIVCPPSNVLCKDCLDILGTKFHAILTSLAKAGKETP